jgi:CRISPR system Cascade subunit CasA
MNVLGDPVFSARQVDSTSMSLSTVLSHLGARREIELTALRPHQQHAWHAFLVQLAALVAQRGGDRRLDRSPEEWRRALVDLAGDGGEAAWCLSVGDLSKPAFLQPPVPEGDLGRFRGGAASPDALDVVITTRNHDVKRDRMMHPRAEHWVFALLTLQTMEGFLGRGNYGIARMNSGFGSRPAVGFAPGLGWAERFHRDVEVWLRLRPTLVEELGYAEEGGHALLWTLPWDGRTSRSLQSCDPFFVEVCRRVRLVPLDGGGWEARLASSETQFLDAKEWQGDTGDAWTPISAEGKALTVGGDGFSYRKMTDLLFTGEYRRRPALELGSADPASGVVVAQVLARGQGKTDGFHERVIPVPGKIRARMGVPQDRDALAALARARVERSAAAQRRVLRPALCSLLQGGPEALDLTDRRTDRWVERLDAAIDSVFFDDLWSAADLTSDEANRRWDLRLVELAQRELEDAIGSAPVPLATRPRAVARAEMRFDGAARKHLGGAFQAPAFQAPPSSEEVPA